jgi:hypothetical protein
MQSNSSDIYLYFLSFWVFIHQRVFGIWSLKFKIKIDRIEHEKLWKQLLEKNKKFK